MGQPVSSAPGDPLVGQVLSQRYRILAKLGEGAMAAVYCGLSPRTLKRMVASGVLDGRAVLASGSRYRRWLVSESALTALLSASAARGADRRR